MTPSFRSFALFMALAAAAALPAAAHSPRVFVPQPRQVNPALEYRVVILASNLGGVDRRFTVSRVVPQPLRDPLRQVLHVEYVPSGDTRLFTLAEPSDVAGLLEVKGAPQIVVRARLEIFEAGERIETVVLPAVAAEEHEDEDEAKPAGEKGSVVLEHGGKNDLHLQGLERSASGSVTTDLTLVNFEAHHEGECAISILDATGLGILGLPFLHVPANAAIAINDVLGDAVQSAGGDLREVWGAASCEEESFTMWAAVYRDNGRDVEYVLPSATLRP